MKRVRAGELDRYVTIQKPVETVNTDFGGTTESWVEHCKMFVKTKNFTRAMEDFVGGMERAQKTVIFTGRYDASITTRMRLVHDTGQIYNIRNIQEPPDMRRVMMDMYAEAEE